MAIVYYRIYLKNLHNGAGYIDVGLDGEQLLKDYLQYLDIGVRGCRSYTIPNPTGTAGNSGALAVNFADITAISITS